jgi:ribosomal protein L35AE/L33A
LQPEINICLSYLNKAQSMVRENMPKALYGFIVSYRTGPKTQRSKECILRFPKFESPSEAARLIGRKVAWPVGERKVRGKIVALHGTNGLVRVRFRKGVHGQAIGTPIEVVG